MKCHYIILYVSDLLNKAKFKARRGLNELDKILLDGRIKAEQVANKTLKKVREAIGLYKGI